MAGLARIAKMYGGMTVNGKKYVWDYAIDKAVPAEDMPLGSDRHALSEKMRWLKEPQRTTLTCAARGCDGCAVCKPHNAKVSEGE